MKKPINETKTIKRKSRLLKPNTEYTIDELKSIIDKMQQKNVKSVQINTRYSYATYVEIKETREETKQEAEKRYQGELTKYNNYLKKNKVAIARKKQKLIKEATKLGLKVVEED